MSLLDNLFSRKPAGSKKSNRRTHNPRRRLFVESLETRRVLDAAPSFSFIESPEPSDASYAMEMAMELEMAMEMAAAEPVGEDVSVSAEWGEEGNSSMMVAVTTETLVPEYAWPSTDFTYADAYDATGNYTDTSTEYMNEAPTIVINSQSDDGFGTFTIDIAVSDPEGEAVDLSIDWGDGTYTQVSSAAALQTLSHSYSSPGSYYIFISGTDQSYNYAYSGTSFEYINEAPSVSISSQSDDGNGLLSIDIATSDPEGDDVELYIDWGDGSTTTIIAASATESLTHQYASSGSYYVTISATDTYFNYGFAMTSLEYAPKIPTIVNATANFDPKTGDWTISGTVVDDGNVAGLTVTICIDYTSITVTTDASGNFTLTDYGTAADSVAVSVVDDEGWTSGFQILN
jgi:hypothetical protein